MIGAGFQGMVALDTTVGNHNRTGVKCRSTLALDRLGAIEGVPDFIAVRGGKVHRNRSRQRIVRRGRQSNRCRRIAGIFIGQVVIDLSKFDSGQRAVVNDNFLELALEKAVCRQVALADKITVPEDIATRKWFGTYKR